MLCFNMWVWIHYHSLEADCFDDFYMFDVLKSNIKIFQNKFH